jgi:hypothetical protein
MAFGVTVVLGDGVDSIVPYLAFLFFILTRVYILVARRGDEGQAMTENGLDFVVVRGERKRDTRAA